MKTVLLIFFCAVSAMAQIHISETESKKMGVIAQEIRLIRSESIGPLIGMIDYSDKGAKNYTLGAEATVVELLKYKGDDLKKGDIICRIASSELLGSMYELNDLRNRLKLAKEYARKDTQLYKEGVISLRESEKSVLDMSTLQVKIGELESRFTFAGADIRAQDGMIFTVRAKQNGVLADAPQKAGEKIEPFRPYLKIVSASRLNVYLKIPPKLIDSIQKNGAVLDREGKTIGHILSIATSVETLNNSAMAVAALNVSSSRYRPGTSSEFYVSAPMNEKWALLPRSSVTKYKKNDICFVKNTKGYAVKTIHVKKIYKDHIAVAVEGFTPHTQVATGGIITLKGSLNGMGFE